MDRGDESVRTLQTDKFYEYWDPFTYSYIPIPKVVDTTLLQKFSEASAITRSALMSMTNQRTGNGGMTGSSSSFKEDLYDVSLDPMYAPVSNNIPEK